MSGIVGILERDGAQAEPGLLQRLTAAMRFRGPDARQTWTRGEIGLGFALLKTSPDLAEPPQPYSQDGEVWIVADARVDARAELVGALGAPRDAGDADLILRAYARWEEACVEHLLGDFAFAIWDGRRRRLYCARDQMGIKPFYTAQHGATLVFGNTLECLRLHPGVSSRLNEEAIADVLLFDAIQDPNSTSFADIQCLPPAATLSVDLGAAAPKQRRYWKLPIDEPLELRRRQEYIEQFRELFTKAVSDRIQTDRVAIHMSGGLDSTAVAACARQCGGAKTEAFTIVYDRLFHDPERRYAGLAAEALGIPIHWLTADDFKLYQSAGEATGYWPELDHDPLRAIFATQSRRMADRARVALYCEGPDNALEFAWGAYLGRLVRRGQWGRLGAAVGRHLVATRRIPLLHRMARRGGRLDGDGPYYPTWIRPEFAARMRLRERWEAGAAPRAAEHPYRPEAYASYGLATWRGLFERGDPGFSGVPMETRHPFFDLRLLRFLLAVPAVPWCADKHLIREAMRGDLPEEIRKRPKQALGGDPVVARLRSGEAWPGERMAIDSKLFEYVVDDGTWRNQDSGGSIWGNWINLRPLSLSLGLTSLRQPNRGAWASGTA